MVLKDRHENDLRSMAWAQVGGDWVAALARAISISNYHIPAWTSACSGLVLASAIFYFAKLILCDETSEVWITSGNKEPCCENGNLVSLLILFAISLPALQYLSLLGPLLFGPGMRALSPPSCSSLALLLLTALIRLQPENARHRWQDTESSPKDKRM